MRYIWTFLLCLGLNGKVEKRVDYTPMVIDLPEVVITCKKTNLDQIKSLIGIPYVWGGMSRKGFDCSGLTKYLYKRLPRSSYDQRKFLKITKNPERGDLVFFGVPVHHVGVYLGNNKMLHASCSKGVTIASVDVMGEPKSYGKINM